MEQELRAEDRVPYTVRETVVGLNLGRKVRGKRLGKARVCKEEEKTVEIPESYGMTAQEKRHSRSKGVRMASCVTKRRNQKSEKM